MADEKDGVPIVDVVEGTTAVTSYAAMQEVNRDTTDDAWGKGVYADQQSEGPARPAPITASAPVPDVRRSRAVTAAEDDDAPVPKSPVLIAVAVAAGAVSLVLIAALALGYV